MLFRLTILGSNAAIPAYGRHPTAQVLNINHQQFLIDCGEGTQIQMQKYKIRKSRLDHVFISHLHGDHYFGLIGLITSFSLNGRQNPFHIYGPSGLKEIIDIQLKHGRTELKFELKYHFTDLDHSGMILDNDYLTVETIALEHRIDCTGFIFREKMKPRNIIPEKIKTHGITVPDILNIKKGLDYTDSEGNLIRNRDLTTDPPVPRSYAFVTDTLYKESHISPLRNVDLLYHEATFDQSEVERAKKTFHTTSKQAAELAKKAGVGKLVIGHFSSRYEQLDLLLSQARAVFPKSELAIEGVSFEI